MDLSQVVRNFKGVQSKRETLDDNTMWFKVPVKSDQVDLVLIANEDASNALWVLMVDDMKIDPNRTDNEDIDPGYLILTDTADPRSWIILSADLYYWVRPVGATQNYYWATFTQKQTEQVEGREWLPDGQEKPKILKKEEG